jgi:hypothetical protein
MEGAEQRWPPIAVKLKGVIAAQKPYEKKKIIPMLG